MVPSGAMATLPTSLLDEARGLLDDTIELRRRIHRHPEIGLTLPRTQQVVLDALAPLGLDVRTGTLQRDSRAAGTARSLRVPGAASASLRIAVTVSVRLSPSAPRVMKAGSKVRTAIA